MFTFSKKKISIITAICILMTSSSFQFNYDDNNIYADGLTTQVKSNPHAYIYKKIEGYNTQYIRVDNSPESDYKVIIAPSKEDGEFLGDIVNKNEAISGMNGAYFAPKAYGNKINETHADRIHNSVEYSKRTDTGDRVIMGFDKNGSTIMYQTDKINKTERSKIVEGIGNFPALLIDGKDVLYNFDHLIDAKMKKKTNKTFLCSDDNKGVYFGIIKSISMLDIPKVLKTMGCTNALNMDAGASTSLVYNMSAKVKSWSPVMDSILVVKKSGLTNIEKKKLEKLGSGKIDNIKYGIYSGYQKLKKSLK